MDPIEVVVRRGRCRRGDAPSCTRSRCATARSSSEAGDPDRVAFLRSSAKPFQALPLVRARDDLTTEEIAIASASHLASPEQLAAVRSLLAKAPAEEDELECGPEPTALQHNCSGKHAGHARALPGAGLGERRLPARDAPGPARLPRARSRPRRTPTRTRSRPRSTAAASLTFALPLERMALMFSRLEQVDGGAPVAAAMRAHPELIRGPIARPTRC